MTEGSSQGLFVVVAVVIFGIFVAISYTLFRDTLSPALASMFNDSFSMVNENFAEKIDLKDSDFSLNGATRLNPGNKEGVFLLKWNGTYTTSWGGGTPVGLAPTERIKLAWGEKLVITMDVKSSVDSKFSVDYNAQPLPEYSSTIDYYGTTKSGNGAYIEDLKANEKVTIEYFWVNDNESKNPEHHDLYDYSWFGIEQRYLNNGEQFEISNISYYITKQ